MQVYKPLREAFVQREERKKTGYHINYEWN